MRRALFLISAWLLLLAGGAFAQYTALDPTRIVPDARVIGTGYSFIGLAEGTAAIYTNPAGLAEATGWQMTSMSGKFLDEYSYLSFSGLYNTNVGTFGLAYAGTSIAGAFATTIEAGSDPNDPIYTFDLSQPEMGNNNSVLALSYGNGLKDLPYLKLVPFADRITVGTTLKLFSAKLYGDAITGGDASGMDMDFGAKFFPPQKWLTFGVAAQNFLPSTLGGKLTYASGHEESYPAVLRAGSVCRVLGKTDSLLHYGEHDVRLMIDFDTYPTFKNYPLVWHLGTEWRPLPILTIRGGIDQDAIGNGAGGLSVVSDNAFGVGLNMGGFNFDYAYHTFAGMPNIDNHYFSLSYAVPAPPVVEIKEKLIVREPKDKTITFADRTGISGTVADPAVKTLKVNDSPTRFSLRGEFSQEATLSTGKNKFAFNAYDSEGKLLQTKVARLLRLVTFPDVPVGYWVDKPISLLAMQKIITGYPNGTFKPEGNITRAEMCTLLMKSLSSEARVAPAKFKDVPIKHWAAKFIALAANQGVVMGYPDKTFRPNGKITRAEGLAMIARFGGISEETYAAQFPDVIGDFWAAKIMAGSYRAGLLDFLKGRNFEPKKALTRAETVEMLFKTQVVQDILAKDLLNWESY